MARRRASPETNAILRASAKKCWENGAGGRQREYLAELKQRDFFRWKARRSYIVLSADDLRRLWDGQGGKCALTGRALDDTAELDHIVPVSRDGDNSYGNSRWLCRPVNQAKHNLTDDEFFEMCRQVTQSEAYTEWIGKQLMEAMRA
jgi:5-methylcytosine-specific restriction endonuclease McrA